MCIHKEINYERRPLCLFMYYTHVSVKVKVKVILRLTVSRPAFLGVRHLGPATSFSPSVFNYY
jgi:hypothetical protein